MVYKYTIDNIMALMQSVGILKAEQIFRFFLSESPAFKTEYYLNQLVIKNILKYDSDNDTYAFVGAARKNDEIEKKHLKAFWAVSAIGSTNLLEILIPRYPFQFLFILNDGEVFDLTVVESVHDALLAQRIRSESLQIGASDIVTHIAILKRDEDAYMLDNCGFDNYCIIDPNTHRVKYVRINEN